MDAMRGSGFTEKLLEELRAGDMPGSLFLVEN
jgi:hypothetical protein